MILVIGAGAIWREFYQPILGRLGLDYLTIDPVTNADFSSVCQVKRREFSLVLILSPPAFHSSNIADLIELGFEFSSLIIEKPMVQTVAEFEIIDTLASKSVATVTPWRLSFAATILRSFLAMHEKRVEELHIVYGELYRWPLTQLGTDNTCFKDLGPHFFDMATYILNSQSVLASEISAGTNSFFLTSATENCSRVTLTVSREYHRPSFVTMLDGDGDRTTVSLAPGTDSLFTESKVVSDFIKSFSLPEPIEVDSLFESFYETLEHNELFSSYQEFRPFLELQDF